MNLVGPAPEATTAPTTGPVEDPEPTPAPMSEITPAPTTESVEDVEPTPAPTPERVEAPEPTPAPTDVERPEETGKWRMLNCGRNSPYFLARSARKCLNADVSLSRIDAHGK